jgi:hypothetical protein
MPRIRPWPGSGRCGPSQKGISRGTATPLLASHQASLPGEIDRHLGQRTLPLADHRARSAQCHRDRDSASGRSVPTCHSPRRLDRRPARGRPWESQAGVGGHWQRPGTVIFFGEWWERSLIDQANLKRQSGIRACAPKRGSPVLTRAFGPTVRRTYIGSIIG